MYEYYSIATSQKDKSNCSAMFYVREVPKSNSGFASGRDGDDEGYRIFGVNAVRSGC